MSGMEVGMLTLFDLTPAQRPRSPRDARRDIAATIHVMPAQAHGNGQLHDCALCGRLILASGGREWHLGTCAPRATA